MIRAVIDYMQANTRDPFKVAVATRTLGEYHRKDGAPEEVLRKMAHTVDGLLGVCDLAVYNDWRDHLRTVPWWQRGKVSQSEREWRESRYAQRAAAAEAEVSILTGCESADEKLERVRSALDKFSAEAEALARTTPAGLGCRPSVIAALKTIASIRAILTPEPECTDS